MIDTCKRTLESRSITIEARSDEDGKLLVPVTKREIIQKIRDEFRYAYQDYEITIETIWELGLYNVLVQTIEGNATLKLWVVPLLPANDEPSQPSQKLDQRSNQRGSGLAPGLTLIDLRHRKGVAPALK
jgi:hypothetical protein